MMRKGKNPLLLLTAFILAMAVSVSSAEFAFKDERFQGKLTTENLNAIIDTYELYDGWYWTTPPEVQQTFHGRPESPGWTTTAEQLNRKAYLSDSYGCRWPINTVRRVSPDRGGYAECFAFAQFVGYLLSGELNPQHNWKFYYSMEAAHGLQVGDIVRVEYRKKKKSYHHSAVVYSVNGDEILFLQVSGGFYNRISVGTGFTDGNIKDETSETVIGEIPGLKISRYIPETE